MLCFKGSKGYKVVPKKKEVKAATSTSTSTSTNQTSAPRTRNGTGTGTGTAAVTQPTNRVAAKSTRPSPDRSRNPPYSNSRPSPSRRHNPEQGPPIQPPRQQSKVARTNNMASQNGIFYGRADSALTSGFGDDESATAVQNPTSKSQGSSSSNTVQSQAHDRIPSHEGPVINTAAAAASSSSSSSSSASPRKAPNCNQKKDRRGEEHCHIESHNKTMWRMRMGYREEFRLFAYDVLAIMLLHYHGYRRKCNYQFLPMGLHQVAEKCNRIHGHYSSYLVYTVQNVGMNSAGIAAPTIGLS
ncbi:hypothetical protein FOBRF1_010508 [Fusarium oxysporum]